MSDKSDNNLNLNLNWISSPLGIFLFLSFRSYLISLGTETPRRPPSNLKINSEYLETYKNEVKRNGTHVQMPVSWKDMFLKNHINEINSLRQEFGKLNGEDLSEQSILELCFEEQDNQGKQEEAEYDEYQSLEDAILDLSIMDSMKTPDTTLEDTEILPDVLAKTSFPKPKLQPQEELESQISKSTEKEHVPQPEFLVGPATPHLEISQKEAPELLHEAHKEYAFTGTITKPLNIQETITSHYSPLKSTVVTHRIRPKTSVQSRMKLFEAAVDEPQPLQHSNAKKPSVLELVSIFESEIKQVKRTPLASVSSNTKKTITKSADLLGKTLNQRIADLLDHLMCELANSPEFKSREITPEILYGMFVQGQKSWVELSQWERQPFVKACQRSH